MASNGHPVWRGHYQEAKRGETGGRRIPWHGEAMGVVSSPVCATGVSLIARGCLLGATPWTSAVTFPHGRNGLNARQRAVLSTFSEPALCRHVPRELLHSALPDLTPIIAATACHQRNYVETYSRSMDITTESGVKLLGHSSVPVRPLFFF